MAETWTISEAARRCGCPRSTLQRAVRAERLHLTADHQLTVEELTQAGYFNAAAAQQPHATAAQQARHDLASVLCDMQRSMERLTDMVMAIQAALQQMQQERSRSSARPPAGMQQARSMERQRRAPQGRTHVPGYDPEAAAARMAQLRQDGLSLAQIAERLNQEGMPTRRGLPWKKGLVGWFLTNYASGHGVG